VQDIPEKLIEALHQDLITQDSKYGIDEEERILYYVPPPDSLRAAFAKDTKHMMKCGLAFFLFAALTTLAAIGSVVARSQLMAIPMIFLLLLYVVIFRTLYRIWMCTHYVITNLRICKLSKGYSNYSLRSHFYKQDIQKMIDGQSPASYGFITIEHSTEDNTNTGRLLIRETKGYPLNFEVENIVDVENTLVDIVREISKEFAGQIQLKRESPSGPPLTPRFKRIAYVFGFIIGAVITTLLWGLAVIQIITSTGITFGFIIGIVGNVGFPIFIDALLYAIFTYALEPKKFGGEGKSFQIGYTS